MFQGDARAALDLYASVFADFSVLRMDKFGQDQGEMSGKVQQAEISFAGHNLIVIDSPAVHGFGFTPSMSLFVNFEAVETLDLAFQRLSHGGEVMMPLDDYGFSRRFGWLADRFGVSWQLNLPHSV